jgi:hypothetical protein
MNQTAGPHSLRSASRLHILIARNLKKTQYIAMNTSCVKHFVCGLLETHWNKCLCGKRWNGRTEAVNILQLFSE